MATEDLFISLPDSKAVEVHCTVLNRIMLRTWDTSINTEHVMLADLRINQVQARFIATALLAAADEQDKLDAAMAYNASKPARTAPYIDIVDWFREGIAEAHPDWSTEAIEEQADERAGRYAR